MAPIQFFLQCFDLFFIAQLWEFFVAQTNLHANQKRGATEKSVWYPVSVEETKGWVAIYLCMGIINKPNIPSNWNTAPILWCHNVKNKITSERYF